MLLVFIVFTFSCRKDFKNDLVSMNVIKDEKAISALKDAYEYEDFDVIASKIQSNQIISSASVYSKSFKEISKHLNLINLRLFINPKEGVTVVVFPFLNSNNKAFALKGSFLNGNFIVFNEIFVEKIRVENKLFTVVCKDDEFFVLSTENGIDKIHNFDIKKLNKIDTKTQLKENLLKTINIDKVANDQYGNHGGNGFCQRERNESFSDCYKAEMDELCDGFWGCVGASTPFAAVLVAAACSCSATQVD